MPSRQLTLLCKQIEAQNTDHFGKFYMYVSLLNTVSVRNKSFTDGLPKYANNIAFWRTNHLQIGELPVQFPQQVSRYAQQFINAQPSWSTALYNIVLAYMRQGKISDLTYIIDKMLAHLEAIHGPQSHNQKIYEYISFDAKKAGITQFIKQVSELNKQTLALVDTSCNLGLSVMAAATGFVLVFASIFSLVPSLIGLGLMIGGAYGVYSYVSQLKVQGKKLEQQIKQMESTTEQLPENDSLFGNKNHNAFFASIVTPLPYAVITAGEQLTMSKGKQKGVSEARTRLDEIMGKFSPV